MPPDSSIRPLTGSTSPAAARSRVLLPAPLRPIRATRSPPSIWRSMPFSTSCLVSSRSSSTHRSRTSTAGGRGGSRLLARLARAVGLRGQARLARRRRRRRSAVPTPPARAASAHRGLLPGAGRGPPGRTGGRRGSPGRCRGPGPRRGIAGAPSKAMAPESIAMTRSAAARQRSRRCSASRTETPHSSLRRRRSQISSSPATGSSWEVGSSRRTSFGRVTRAAASATRCSSPPERVSTVRSSRCGMARARATSSTARARAGAGSPRISSGSPISAATVVETTWDSGSWAR